MTPFIDDADFTLHVGDVLDVLRTLPDGSVDCCVTSPPYYGLRDYGTGTWDGGDPDCDHRQETRHQIQGATSQRAGRANTEEQRNENFRDVCGKCGARRTDRQIGLEATPDEYVTRIVAVFRQVRRVLADHGTCWLNLGDSYAGSWGNQGRKEERGTQRPINGGMLTPVLDGRYPDKGSNTGAVPDGLKPKDLVGIPWRVAFALQADGWYLRADIIWAKPNPMPESVTDRPTKAHEYLFLLTKRPRYFYDAEAIREPLAAKTLTVREGPTNYDYANDGGGNVKTANWNNSVRERKHNHAGANARSVWSIATQPYPEAHFATFPEELPRRCILAGCPEAVCRTCGKPRERIVERDRPPEHVKTNSRADGLVKGGMNGQKYQDWAEQNPPQTVGWSDCGHGDDRPGIVLDPFLGSGTVALVARKLGRRSIGIELNPEYAELCARRLQQLSLLADLA